MRRTKSLFMHENAVYGFAMADSRQDWVNPGGENLTERESPYGFSEYFCWRDEKVRPAGPGDYHAKSDPGVDAAYSDRLAQFSSENFAAGVQACGGLGPYPSKKTMTTFLTAYFSKATTAHALARGCNVGNGYPYWICWFSHPAPEAGVEAETSGAEGSQE